MWEKLHPRATPDMLGFIPGWFATTEGSAKEVINRNYAHGGGWQTFQGFELDPESLSLDYPGDPRVLPLYKLEWGDETVVVYQYAWVAIIQKDGSHEIARID